MRGFIYDSAFSNGTYSHSFGFESFIRSNDIKDDESFKKWLYAYLQSTFLYTELLGFLKSLKALDDNNFDEFLQLAKKIHLSTSSSEIRKAQFNITKASLNNLISLNNALCNRYLDEINKCNHYANQSSFYALISHIYGLSSKEFLYFSAKTLCLNALRSVPLSQKKTNALLIDLIDFTALLDKYAKDNFDELCKYFGASSFACELACLEHEIIDFRLFMS